MIFYLKLNKERENSQFYDFYLKPNKERASVYHLPEKDMDSKIDNFHPKPDNDRAFGNELTAIVQNSQFYLFLPKA
jgi:hypothetical protein